MFMFVFGSSIFLQADRNRRGDEDILPMLSPRLKTRPMSAYTANKQGYEKSGSVRPKSAPTRSRGGKSTVNWRPKNQNIPKLMP